MMLKADGEIVEFVDMRLNTLQIVKDYVELIKRISDDAVRAEIVKHIQFILKQERESMNAVDSLITGPSSESW